MEKEPKRRIPKVARFPIFLLGLSIILAGGLAVNALGVGTYAEVATSVVGFSLLVASVAIR